MEKYISIKNKFIIYEHGDISRINHDAENAWSKTVCAFYTYTSYVSYHLLYIYIYVYICKDMDVIYSKAGNGDKRPW